MSQEIKSISADEFSSLNYLESVEMWPDDMIFHGQLGLKQEKNFIIYNPSPVDIAFNIANLPERIQIEPRQGFIEPQSRTIFTMTMMPIANAVRVPKVEDFKVFICQKPKTAVDVEHFWKHAYQEQREMRIHQFIVRFFEADIGPVVASSIVENKVEKKEEMKKEDEEENDKDD